MPKIKLIAIDLDDTLLRTDLTISERARRAIRQASAQGIHVTLATGRMFPSALPFAQELQLNLPLITYQGALVKYADGREVYHRPIPLGEARRLVEFLAPYHYHVKVYLNDRLYMEKDSPEGQRYVALARVPISLVDHLPDVLSQEPTKIVAIAEPAQLDGLALDVRREFGNTVHVTKSKATFLEFSHPRATKGIALQYLAQSLGIEAQEVMAIGDSPNDLDMLEYAGWGVAMANAVQEVRQIARYVTLSNDDDGVAEAIEKLAL